MPLKHKADQVPIGRLSVIFINKRRDNHDCSGKGRLRCGNGEGAGFSCCLCFCPVNHVPAAEPNDVYHHNLRCNLRRPVSLDKRRRKLDHLHQPYDDGFRKRYRLRRLRGRLDNLRCNLRRPVSLDKRRRKLDQLHHHAGSWQQ